MKSKIIIITLYLALFSLYKQECSNYDDDYYCEGTQRSFNLDMDNDAFQTPPRNDIYGRYRSTYQDMRYLVGYVQQKYNSDKTICTLTFITKVNSILGVEGTDYKIKYTFGETEQDTNNIQFNSAEHSYPNGIEVSARIINLKTNNEIVKLELEDEYLIWDNIVINLPEEYENGQKGSIVELFGWPYEDIGEECEFIGKAGYLGVKIFSPNEQLLTDNLVEGVVLNPWWYGTQFVSFKLTSRYGNKKQLKAMINKCRSFNVRIYAETVINHCTGGGNDMYDDHINKNCDHWGYKAGSGGSPFWGIHFRNENNPITNKKPVIEYPAVPYFPSDFHCIVIGEDVNDEDDLETNKWDWSLADVNTEKDYVRQRIADYYIELLSLGISGISIPNVLQIKQESLIEIFLKLKDNIGGSLPNDFIAILIPENIDIEEKLCSDDENNFNYGIPFTNKLSNAGFSEDDILKIKFFFKGFLFEDIKFLPLCDDDEWRIAPERQVISLEFSDDINMSNDYPIYIRDGDIETHRQLSISLFENEDYNYNFKIRNIFSSFSLFEGLNGIPDGKSDCSYCATENCKSNCESFPYRKAYNPISEGYDCGNLENWVEGEYTRVHRDQSIINAMRKWMFPEKPQMEENELYDEERLKANCNEKCLICNEESKKENLCLDCNVTKGYYPVIYDEKQKFYECYKYDEKYDRLYFDEKEKVFKSCYETCKTCEKIGNPENHNCLSCDSNLIQKPGSSSETFNCVTNCVNSYYFTISGQYKCTEIPYCPSQASIYIKEKNKCIDSCQNDADYKYLYNGNCYEICPENTIQDHDKFICKEKNYESLCTLSGKELDVDNFYDFNLINSIVKNYRDEYFYTNKHIIKFINNGYSLYIYKDLNCINLLSLGIITIDPISCINKIKRANNIEEDLIVVYFERTKIKNAGYLLYNPITGQRLNFENTCSDLDIKTTDTFIFINLKIQSNEENEPTECQKGLYPVAYLGQPISYKNCKNKDIVYDKIYFDPIQELFLPCYEMCKTCIKEGNVETQNCLTCEEGYIIHPHDMGKVIVNCAQKCLYRYYFTQTGVYKCTPTPQCPLDFNKFVEAKNQCIDDCKNDDTYRFLYNGICHERCPEGTNVNPDEGDYICKEPNINRCTLSKKEGELKNFYDHGGLDSLVKSYNDEFSYTNQHVSEINNTNYNIIIYKDENCLTELNLEVSIIDFGECYNKVQEGIDEDLIVVLIEKFDKNGHSSSSYSLYNPKDATKLDASTICKDETIIIEKNIIEKLDEYNIDFKTLSFLTDQNIDIFNISGAFYMDICFEFESPNKRDITLEDRLKTFYPNVSFCDIGCVNKGVNLTTMKAICNCRFNDISNNEIIGDFGDIGGVGEIMEIISSSNIEVLKCFKYLFKKFEKSIGGYIILFSLVICIIFGLLFYFRDLNLIKVYIANKTTGYINYIADSIAPKDKKIGKIEEDLSKNNIIVNINNEIKNSVHRRSISNHRDNKIYDNSAKQEIIDQGKEFLFINKINSSKEKFFINLKESNSKNNLELKGNEKDKEKDKEIDKKKEKDILEEKEDFNIYLKPDIDDQDFEELVLEDKRSFQEYFCDSLSEKQIFINTFLNNEPFRPFSIKIILLILNLVMYIVVNGLFYGESTISEIYHIEGDDPFFGFFPRTIARFVYSAIVGAAICFIIDCFFIDEKRMKKIFIRNKDNVVHLKYEITNLNIKIKNRYLGFIFLTLFLLILFWFYLLCFNYVYTYTQYEWIKSSIVLIIIMQILSTLTALSETALRFISFMFKSERIFRFSKLLD